MLKIFICEDNEKQRNSMAKCISNYLIIENLDIELILSTPNPNEIIKYLKKKLSTGLYFLDIDLQHEMNGIKLAELIRTYDPRGFIVFVTTHEESLYLTFKHKLEAMDFILKDEIFGVNQRICDCISNAYKKYTTALPENENKFIFQISEQKIITFEYKDIIFFETSPETSRKINIHSKNKIIEFYSSLNDIEHKLDSNFFRCHKSYIVNIEHILEVDNKQNRIILQQNNECPLAVRKATMLKKLLHN